MEAWFMSRVLILLTLLSGFVIAGGVDRRPAPVPVWQPTSCPAVRWPGRELRCGRVRVPVRHDRAGGPTFDLSVIIAGSRAASTPPKTGREPVVVLHGGPGATSRPLLSALSRGQVPDFAPEHDLVFFDQRSSDLSPFARDCPPHLTSAQRTALALGSPRERAAAEVREALTCRDELLASGFDPEVLSTAQNAADVNAVRRALGVPRVNLYGVSYGSRLAQEVTRRFPGTVRVMLLDGPVPLSDASSSFAQLLDGFLKASFEACRRDAACAARFPEAAEKFGAWLTRVSVQPPHAELPAITPPDQRVPLRVMALLESLPLRASTPAEVLHDLDALQRGDFGQVGPLLGLLGNQPKWSTTSLVVGCVDGFIPEPSGRTALRFPLLSDAFDPLDAGAQEVCRVWTGTAPQPAALPTAVSAVPTLVLVGAFDFITPPRNVSGLRTFLPDARVVNFSFGGHGQLRPGPTAGCAAILARQFWTDPARTVDAACARTAGRAEAMTFR